MSSTGKKGKSKAAKTPTGAKQSPDVPPASEKIDHSKLLLTALNMTSDNGSFYDTKFFAFSRRASNGRVYGPMPIYANGWVLRTRHPSYFEQLLSDTFGDCIIGNLDGDFPADSEAHVDDYDDSEDSDLEDDDEDVIDENIPKPSAPQSASTSQPPKDTGEAGQSSSQNVTSPKDEPRDATADDLRKPRTGRIIVLPSVAYSTWKALIFYLTTGEVFFNRLRSQIAHDNNPEGSPDDKKSWTVPPCSPKSMYRLAHRLGLEELKEKAKENIKSKLNVKNALEELFSGFTADYSEIRDIEITFAMDDASRRKTVVSDIPLWIDRFAKGELARSANVLSILVLRLGGQNNIISKQQCRHCNRTNVNWSCSQCGNYM